MDRSTLRDMPVSAAKSLGDPPCIHGAVVEDCGTHYALSVTSDSPSVKLGLSGDDALSGWISCMRSYNP
jgi:hypothetical protein